MKKARILSVLLLCVFLTGLFSVPALAVEDPAIQAKAALLIDGETNEVLYEKNADEREYPASLTKVMTALLTFEAIDAGTLSLEQKITAPSSAFSGLDSAGSTANIQPGEILTVNELLACMLINSANEAAAILAVTVGGSLSAFVERMNSRAAELGCENTHFANPTGLHDPEHYTTAWDLTRITQAALHYDHFLELCNSKSYEIPSTNLSDARTLHSTNFLISNWRATGYLYSGAEGVKTGSTSQAGHCLIATAKRTGRALFSVVLGAGVDEESGRIASFTETSRLFDWGFDSFSRETLLTTDDMVTEVKVALSRERTSVVLHPGETVSRLLPTGVKPEELTRKITLNAEVVNAPITAGEQLGEVSLTYGDTVYATVPLLALTDVSASWILTLHYNIIQFFSKTIVQIIALVLLIVAVLLFLKRYGRRKKSRVGNPTRSDRGYRGRRRF